MAQDATIIGTTTVDGTAFTTQLNAAMAAIETCVFGAIDPANQPGLYTVNPGFLWWNSNFSPAQLQVRNATNDGWITILKLDGSPCAALQALLDAKLPLAGGTLTGALLLAADPVVALGAATKQYVDNTSRPAPIRFYQSGNASVANKLAQVVLGRPAQMVAIELYADTAPVGASLTVTLTRKRTSVADDSRSASITTGNNAASVTLGSPMALLQGDRIRFDITSVGSTTPGGNDLMVTARLDP